MYKAAFVICIAMAVFFPQKAETGPRIELDKTEYDFGSFMQHEEKEVKIRVSNTGDTPLEILKTATSCGCALPEGLNGSVIQPGESKELKVRLSSKNGKYHGRLRKYIKIFSNDPVNKETTIWVKINIKAEYIPRTRLIKFQNLLHCHTKKKTVSIKSFMDHPLELKEINAPAKFLDVSFREVAPMDEKTGFALYALDVEADGSKVSRFRNRVTTNITFKPNTAAGLKDTFVVILAFLAEDITVTPEEIDFGESAAGSGKEAVVRLEHLDGKSFVVSRVQSSSPLLSTAVDEMDKHRANVKISLSENTPPGIFQAMVTIIINRRDDCRIVVPVHGMITTGDEEEGVNF